MTDYHKEAVTRYQIPFTTAVTLDNYIQRGTSPGDFLRAVLHNDYRMAYLHADDRNKEILHKIMAYMVDVAPLACWGGPEFVKRWQEVGGINGLMAKMKEVEA